MRITGGSLRNRNLLLRSPKGIRPTASRVREALFSMIGQDLSNTQFLDAFGGSGIMGFEAYSRGADVTICENRKGAFQAIKTFIQRENWSISLIFGSAERGFTQKWDIVFMDPPYDYDPLPWLKIAENHVRDVLIFEHSSKNTMPEAVGNLVKTKTKRYGDCALSFYKSSTSKP